jgi:FtsZ-binding cell division protein ZapB
MEKWWDHDLAEMYYESIESDLINKARSQLEIVYSPITSGFDALKPNAEAQVISNVNEEVLAEVLAKSANIVFESQQRLLEVNHPIARMSELQESCPDTNDELNSQLSNLQNHAETLERHIHNIENSKSWRWTKPLRSILGFLRRLG